MNLRQIEVFRAVMVAGSVTDAARLLHVSQPGISRMLGHIELQLGVSLFHRKRGKLLPTPEAQSLHAEVEQVYRGVQRIDERARDLKTGAGLALRVLASPGTSLEVVPKAVAQLAEQFPSSRIYMETQLVREMVGQLVRHEADVAISTLPIEHTPLVSEAVGTWTLACVFGKGHAFERRRSVSLRDLKTERMIAFSPDTPQGRLIQAWWHDGEAKPSAQIEVRSGQVACALAACGAGIAVVDDLTARAWRSEKLSFRPINKGPTHQIFAVRNANAAPSRLEEEFVKRVKAALHMARRDIETGLGLPR
jgi:DNA-binding transcriptional LysR family regulator